MCSHWLSGWSTYVSIPVQHLRKWGIAEGIFSDVPVSIPLLKEVMADGPSGSALFLSPACSLLGQAPAASGCLLHHLWLQSAQNSLVWRGEGDEEQKSTRRVTHREGGEGPEDGSGQGSRRRLLRLLNETSLSKHMWKSERVVGKRRTESI